jgi:hypothetical protein
MRQRAIWLIVAVLSAAAPAALAAEAELKLLVRGGETDAAGVCVRAAIALPRKLSDAPPEEIRVELTRQGAGGEAAVGQVVRSQGAAELWWIVPAVAAGEKQTWTARLSRKEPPPGRDFSWKHTKGRHLDLCLDGRPVTRYVYAYDTSDRKRAAATYKPFHHVVDAEGKGWLTKGPGGRYTHHRGIFIGWSRLGYDNGKRGDWWHMKGVAQVHQKLAETAAGPVLARSTAVIHWNDPAGKPVLVERRATTALRPPKGVLLVLDFRTELRPARGEVLLEGDPEHAGVQFRAHNDVETARTRYQLPEEGMDARKQRDLPWAAMSFVLAGKRYTVQHMNHPANPKGTVYSAYRDYGRFGAFFQRRLKANESLTVRYRIRVMEGGLPSRRKMQSRWEAFAEPPRAEVVR